MDSEYRYTPTGRMNYDDGKETALSDPELISQPHEGSRRIPVRVFMPAAIITHIWQIQVQVHPGDGKATPARSKGSEGASGPDSGV